MTETIYANKKILELHQQLKEHDLYKNVTNLDELKRFMETHVFAVWDFMSLLKRLQTDITCTTLPWRPSPYPKELVRFINEIVLGEESDIDFAGNYSDHFSLYIKSMQEINANPDQLISLMETLDFDKFCTPAQKKFVTYNLDLADHGKTHEVAAAFFFGRENLIPDMFTAILKDLDSNFGSQTKTIFPHLNYYLERHVEIDGEEHSALSKKCLEVLCGNNQEKWNEAINAGVKSLELRINLWNEILENIKKTLL